MDSLRALDDAPPGEATDRRERDLVERWTELDPAGAAAYAAEAFKNGGSERLLRQAAEAYAKQDPAGASAWAATLGDRAARFVASQRGAVAATARLILAALPVPVRSGAEAP
jgi:hypothetical protein